VERARFGGDYDIPLIVLAHDLELQQAVRDWDIADADHAGWDEEEETV
jgi:hypothetical protein